MKKEYDFSKAKRGPAVRAPKGKVQMAMRIRKSSGNVFRDLGYSPEDSNNLRVRSELMISLTKLIESRGLTQAQAAKLLGVRRELPSIRSTQKPLR